MMQPIRTMVFLLLAVSAPYCGEGLEIPAHDSTAVLVHHAGFTLEFAPQCRVSRWVAYVLTREKARSTVPRSDTFRTDPTVAASASPDDYKGSGFDRGHLAPAADMGWSDSSMHDCFYMTNMAPQAPSFNRGIWKNLESLVRQWATEKDTEYIVTGPILRDGLPTIGSGVAVPELFYKVVLALTSRDTAAIGFILENKGSQEPLQVHAVPVDSVEKVTGLNFFPSLPDSIAEYLESRVVMAKWAQPKVAKEQVGHERKRGRSHGVREPTK